MTMWRQFSKLFDELASGGKPSAGSIQKALEQAASVLMFEMCRADFSVAQVERDAVLGTVKSTFELSDEQACELVDEAQTRAERAVSLHQYTALINDHWGIEEKQRLLLELWRIAYADGVLDKYEEHFARKVANLLHLPHQSFIQAKLQARHMVGGAEEPGTRLHQDV